MIICENCIHKEVCGLEGYYDEALKFCADKKIDPQGKWIFHKDYNESCRYGCNQCGNLNNISSNFCPNCGADMRGDKNETN